MMIFFFELIVLRCFSSRSTDFFYYNFLDKDDQKRPQSAKGMDLFFHRIFMHFCLQNDNLYWLLIVHANSYYISNKRSKRSPNSGICHIWKICTKYLFHLIFTCSNEENWCRMKPLSTSDGRIMVNLV